MGDIYERFLIYGLEQLKRWKEHITAILNHIIFGEVPPLVDEMARHHNMRIRTGPSYTSEIIRAIIASKP